MLAERVDPHEHDAFFLWAGVNAPEALTHARTVYLLAGEIRHDDPDRFVPLRAVPHVIMAQVWLVVRIERLDWGEGAYRAVLRELDRWREAGIQLVGLQVDFDAATKGLAGYAEFLGGLRERLPEGFALSVTGLLDWSAGGDPAALASLAGIVDEVVVQTYQGRETIPGYAAYFKSLSRLSMPYRVGLVEGGEWREPKGLSEDPNFRGYVVFLVEKKAP
ncbi:MAG: DUF3142 domain-containing protein [Novosphingobium sp.]|nr:DUF3142 domain-containing protein [Novosphingobium sp.]